MLLSKPATHINLLKSTGSRHLQAHTKKNHVVWIWCM